MKRVLYFTGYRMVAQEWSGAKMESSIYFEPDEQGLDLFSAYLRSFNNEPVRLLVDLIEEEFRQIQIPLLRGSDRQAILQRNFNKFFHKSEFIFAVPQSIEKKARKEEKLLLIGITNQSLLEPWLRLIEDTRTPLSGIISLPLLSEQYIGSLSSAGKAKILVSQEVPSSLRQSVFINGKLILSRLVPVASFYHGDYASDVVRDIESTQRYLISQRIVERTESISLHILSNKRHLDKLTMKCAEQNFADFHVHEINRQLDQYGIDVKDEQDFSSALFCYLASQKQTLNHYAQAHHKKYFHHHYASLALKVATVAFFAIGVGLLTTSLVRSWIYSNTIYESTLIEQKYRAKFNQLSETIIDSTTSTASMQHIVQTVENIEAKYLQEPEGMLSLISRDISLFSDIRVKNIEWFLSAVSNAETATDVSWDNRQAARQGSRSASNANQQKPVKGFFEVANVDAEFLNFNGNYRYVLSAVDDLEKAMMESGSYFHVEITKRPLDIESDNSLTGDAGVGKAIGDNRAELSFRVVREVETGE
ncbi:MAG: hypothetical protein GY784_07795 [Gammaproteobacteria bacterium]|nr:hypothetical protein [Gammaproteobacteria bacterium]